MAASAGGTTGPARHDNDNDKNLSGNIGMQTSTQQKAADFLQAYGRGELPAGIAFGKALQQVRLDYSEASLDRLDKLLDQVRAKFQPDPEAWARDSAKLDFCLMLAFYLADYIARRAGQPVEWFSYDEAVASLPQDYGLPRGFFSLAVGRFGDRLCLPLGLVQDRLFTDAPPRTCRQYVDDFLQKLAAGNAKAELGQWVQGFLDDVLAGKPVPGGVAFHDRLRSASMDYSLASVSRLDYLLRELRREAAPQYEGFVNEPPSNNLLLFIGLYVATTAARLAQQPIKWLDYEATRALVPDLQFFFETTRCCLIGQKLYTPIATVTEALFAAQPSSTLRQFAERLLEDSKPEIISIYRSCVNVRSAASVPLPMLQALRQAGFLGGYSLYMVAGGATMTPTLLQPSASGQNTLVALMEDTLDAGIEKGRNLLAHNPNRLPFQCLVYDGFANLPTGRTDALVIEVKGYFAPAFGFMLILPYRHAQHEKGFAMFSPKLHTGFTPKQVALEPLFAAFYNGLLGFKGGAEFSVDACLDESI
ncbi:MAG: hypothetical protein K0R03_216 [Moraxellaceae bacterium]|nr:hypothetical protein [Moraxellaceae bacterium]